MTDKEKIAVLRKALADLSGCVYCPACAWAKENLKRAAVWPRPHCPAHTCTAALNWWKLKPVVDKVLAETEEN